MKKFLTGLAFATVGAVSSASAADLAARPYTKAPALAPVYNWTGFYAGLNAGGAWSDTNLGTTTLFPVASYFADTSVAAIAASGNQNVNRTGFTGGVTGGYNWQISNAVVGVEADFNYFGASGSTSTTTVYPGFAPTTFTINSSVSTDWLATVRGRVGFLVTPSLLLYGTGGLAISEVRAGYTFTDTFAAATESGAISSTRYGWTAGVGGEYALMNGWSFKAEYLYVDLGRASTVSNNLAIAGPFAFPLQTFTHTVDLTSNIGRVGINYKFGGPSVTQY
ncbi:outer membrane protein [Tardiphaga sp. 862_B3_N1_1]|uniref:outer membrane protein n=1 Tax=Tardiphaga sp. 862_B3_N1_1 TaxID=3240763 RepID=UPI003F8BB091